MSAVLSVGDTLVVFDANRRAPERLFALDAFVHVMVTK